MPTVDGTPRLGYVPALDGLRAVAVFAVMLTHADFAAFPHLGNAGVTVFFALSGFLITTLLLQERAANGSVSLRRFYGRRALRLLPALIVLIVAAAFIMVILGRGNEIIGDTVPTLFYFMNWTKAAGDDTGLLSHAWSLSIEEQFYLAWPVLLILLLRLARGRAMAVALIVLMGAVAIAWWRIALWAPASFDRVYWATDTRSDALLFGCAAALIWSVRRWAVPRVAVWAATAAILAVSLFSDDAAFAQIGLLTSALAAVVLVSAALGDSSVARIMGWRPLAYVGSISYGLYLFHRPIMRLGTSLFPTAELAPTLVMVVLSFAAAGLSWRYIERPFMGVKRRLVAANREGPARDVVETAPVLPPLMPASG